jgi:hypothetical protein
MKTSIKTLVSALVVSTFCAVNTPTNAFAQDQQQSQMPSQTQQQSAQQPMQEDSSVETLLGEKVTYSVVPALKATPMNNTWGTLLGAYGGAILNKNILVGIGTYATFGHESVNMGYTGLMVEYLYQPHRLLHFGGSLLVGMGTASTMRPSSFRPWGLAENIVRLFSPSQFIVLEPSAFGEVNLSQSLSLSLGASYRYITGYRESLSSVLTNTNLSGISANVGVRFRINDGSQTPQ